MSFWCTHALLIIRRKQSTLTKAARKKMLDFSGISERELPRYLLSFTVSWELYSFNLKLASLLLVGLIRCGFMIKNQMLGIKIYVWGPKASAWLLNIKKLPGFVEIYCSLKLKILQWSDPSSEQNAIIKTSLIINFKA